MNPSANKKLFIAGMGMITPVGGNVAMTAAMVAAGVSAYATSRYSDQNGKFITMAGVPDAIFIESTAEIDEGIGYGELHDHIIKMAIIAVKEACAQQPFDQPIPLIIGMPDVLPNASHISASSLVKNLVNNCQPWLSAQQSRTIHTGRAAGMDALDFAFSYLYDSPNDFMLIGGSDSYRNHTRLRPLGAAGRLAVGGRANSFAPGEAAAFLLLTRRSEFALVRNGNMIAVNKPGMTDELGHLYSDEPYRGDGLDKAFKAALINQGENSIHSIYSSMNGESHWAKEYGVAFLRNRKVFKDPVRTEHPADCYGDLGSATATTLIGLAAEHLFKSTKAQAHLVYSSSDTGRRGAVVVEKLNA